MNTPNITCKLENTEAGVDGLGGVHISDHIHFENPSML